MARDDRVKHQCRNLQGDAFEQSYAKNPIKRRMDDTYSRFQRDEISLEDAAREHGEARDVTTPSIAQRTTRSGSAWGKTRKIE